MKILTPLMVVMFFLFFVLFVMSSMKPAHAEERPQYEPYRTFHGFDRPQHEQWDSRELRERLNMEQIREQQNQRFRDQINKEWHGVRRYSQRH